MIKSSVLIFLALGIIWGSNFIYMKMAAEHIDAMQVVFYRVLFGFIPVFLYALYLKVLKLEDLQHYKHFFVMSLLAAIVYYYGFVKGSFLLLSGIAGALSGSIPIFSFLLATLFLKEEKITKQALLGVMVGFFGVILISGVYKEDLTAVNFEGILAVILGSLSVGASFIYAKKYLSKLNLHPAALTTYQLGFALFLMMFITNFKGIHEIWNHTHAAVGMTVGLGFLGTGVAFIGYYYIIEKLGALKASSITYIPPVVALIIGFFIVKEEIQWMDFFATMMIFLGVFLINKRQTT